MSWWELFTALASAASIVSLAIAASSFWNGRATRALSRSLQGDTQALMRSLQGDTQALMRSLHADTEALIREMQAETRALLERLDQRADERHREVIQAIAALRAP